MKFLITLELDSNDVVRFERAKNNYERACMKFSETRNFRELMELRDRFNKETEVFQLGLMIAYESQIAAEEAKTQL